MSQTLSLHRLQQTDSRIDRVHARILEIQKILENDEALRLATTNAKMANEAHVEAERVLRAAENIVQDQRLKIEQTESSLYSGAVMNPKELQDLQNDVASLNRHLATLEDRLLESMLACDDAQTFLQNAEKNLDIEHLRVASQNSDLNNEMEEMIKNKLRLATERQAIAVSIPENLLAEYESLRKQKHGVAVAVILDNSCDVCGATLTPAQSQIARSSSQMIHCPSCGRILFGN